MKSRVGILGCGWLGLPLGQKLTEKGHEVYGNYTRAGQEENLIQAGIIPFRFSLGDAILPNHPFLDSETLILAIPPSKINLNDLHFFLEYFQNRARIKRVILMSSTGIYLPSDSPLQEDRPGLVNENSALARIETLINDLKDVNAIILRLGGLIGYDRHPLNFLKSGKVFSDPEGRVNLVHRDDVIRIICALMESHIENQTFNCCCDEHPTKREFYSQIARENGQKLPEFVENQNNLFKLVANDKLKSALKFQFMELTDALRR